MRRGSAVLSLSLAILLGTFALNLLNCMFAPSLHADVPRCSSVSSCVKATGLQGDARWYADLVGRSWYYTNKTLEVVDASRQICTGDQNLSVVARSLVSVFSSYSAPAAEAIYFADQSVAQLVEHLDSYSRDLNRGGIEFVPYDDLRDVYSRMLYALRVTESGSNGSGTALARALDRYSQFHPALRKIAASLGVHLPEIVSFMGSTVVRRWPHLPGYFVSAVVGTLANEYQMKFYGIDLIDSAVGLGDSVYRSAAPFLTEYYSLLDDYDRHARSDLQDAVATEKEVEELAVKLKNSSYVRFTPEMLALLPESKATRSQVSGSPETQPYEYIVLARRALSSVRHNVLAFQLKDDNYLVHLYAADRNLAFLHKLENEINRRLDEQSNLATLCYKFLAKYHPLSSYVAMRLPGYVAVVKTGDLDACAAALRLVVLDRNYARDDAILASCEARARCGAKTLPSDYPCVGGDVRSRIGCCLAYLDRKRSDLRATDLYANYQHLRSAITSLLALYYDPALASDFYSLPTDFLCPDELSDASAKATKIYLKLRKDAASFVRPEVYVLDPVSATTVSTVRIRFEVDAGGADILTSYKLPFTVVAFRTLSSNGLWVVVDRDGRTVHLRGSGSAVIEAQVMPVSLKVREGDGYGGYKYVHVRNDLPVPVEYSVAGDLISSTPNVSYSRGKLVFSGVGEATLRVRVVDVNYALDGDSAYVSLRNPTEYDYRGDVVIPLSSGDPPAGCRSVGGVTICSVHVKPFSETSLELRDVNAGTSLMQTVDLNYGEDQPAKTLFSAESTVRTVMSIDQNKTELLRRRVLRLISELNAWYSRASELNIAYLLPFSRDSLENFGRSVRETNDYLYLSSVEATLSAERAEVISKAKAYLSALPQGSDVRGLAERALNTGDYMLALALAASYEPDRRGGGVHVPYAATLLALISLAILVYYLRGQKPKKRKRIPKI